jgi:hypothetical protein
MAPEACLGKFQNPLPIAAIQHKERSKMKKIYPQNERLKHQYQTFLRHTGGLDQKTINKIFTALRQFEESTGCKPHSAG